MTRPALPSGPDAALRPLETDAAPLATLEPIRFGEFLRDRALITEEQWLAALADHWSARVGRSPRGARRARPGQGLRSEQRREQRSIGATIVACGFLPREVVEAEARVFHEDLEVVEV